MFYVAAGCFGFLAIHLLDVVSLGRATRIKAFTWLPGMSLLVYSIIMVSLQPSKLSLSPAYVWLGWTIFLISGILLVYSLFINLPFRETYIDSGVGDKLVTTGLYALVRHPGVDWFILFMLSLILISRASLLLVAAPVFIMLDIILVVIQDKFFFGRMFAGYDSYRRQTPMLVPNRQSVNAFFSSLKQQGIARNAVEGEANGRSS